MMAASLISGDTTIYNAACEPEITDLAQFIVALGGAITVGDGVVHVRGAKELDGTDYTPIGDRIVAGTYLALAGAGGDITVRGVDGAHIQAALRILQDKGCVITSGQGFVRCVGHGRMRAAKNIVTRPYPGFATDLQAQFMAIECLARGRTKIVESVFESRYAHVGELCKMGACIDIDVRGDSAIVVGVQDLDGGVVSAQDLRGGAALVLAGVFCKDVTTVHGVHHIDRGYYKIESDLGELGVEVVRSAE
jgi:UDP-N-acetylglucosamine 1-carboxyvinyltransferase